MNKPHRHVDNNLDSHPLNPQYKKVNTLVIDQIVYFSSNFIIIDAYFQVNPNCCECGPLVKGYYTLVTLVTRPSRALLGCISNVAIVSLCCPTAVNGRDREAITGNFIPSLARDEQRHTPLSRHSELGWQITDTLALKEMRNESKSRAL